MPGTRDDRRSHEERTEEFLRALNSLSAEAIRSSRTASDFLQRTLDAGVRAVEGHRGFLALVNHETGELEISSVSGEGWTEENCRMRLHLAQETRRGITGHVALTGEAYVTGDVDKDPYYLRYFQDVKSEIAVPIQAPQGQTRGVINIDSPKSDYFDSDDCAHLSALAQAAAVALALQVFRARESALIEIGTNLTTTLEIEPLLQKVVDVAGTVLEFEDCSVFLLDEQTDQLMLRASCCLYANHIGKAVLQIGEGITGWVAENGKPARVEDPTSDPRWVPAGMDSGSREIGPFLAVPIVSRDRILGILRVLRTKSHAPWFSNRFTEADERLLSTIASQLGAAIENARSFQRLVRAERMAAWGELSARSAHMIGNRSFALKGDLNEMRHLMASMSHDDRCKEVIKIVDSMDAGIGRLDEILREFRDYVVATQITLAEHNINAVLKESVKETFPKRAPVQLDLQLGDSIPTLLCDDRRLKRVFSELIENAVSFMPDGGTLRIASRMLSQEEHAAHRLAHSREFVQLEFSDTGPGVPEADKSRIFRPFYTSRVKGMGLGLSIVKGIVEAHQGVIRETGEQGKGARFLIFLPLNPQ